MTSLSLTAGRNEPIVLPHGEDIPGRDRARNTARPRLELMAIALDTLAYSRRLREAGFSEQQAEGQAQALAAAMTDTLATRQDLRELEVRSEARFATIDARFASFEKHVDSRLAEFEKRFEYRLEASLADLERRITVRMLAAIGSVAALVKLL